MHDGYMPLNGRRTSMGYADYAAGGIDRHDDAHCPFVDPEDVLTFDSMQEYGLPSVQAMIDCFQTRYKHRCKMLPDGVNVGGVYITMMSHHNHLDISLPLTSGGGDPMLRRASAVGFAEIK